MKRNIILFCLLSIISQLLAQGETGFEPLRFSIDPVAVGRGGVAVIGGSGLFGIYANPAILAESGRWEIAWQRRNYGDLPFIKNLAHLAAGGAYRMDRQSVIGAYYQPYRADIKLFPEEKTETDNYQAVALVYSRSFTDRLRAGLALKYLRRKYFGATASGWALDLGVQLHRLLPGLTLRFPAWQVPQFAPLQPRGGADGLTLAAALLNAGPQISLIDESQKDPLPQILRVGGAWQILSSPLLQVRSLFEFEKLLVYRKQPIADEFYEAWFTAWKGRVLKEAIYHFGLEARLGYFLTLRGGAEYRPLEVGFNSTTLTCGAGVDCRYFSLQFGRWLNREDMNFLHRDGWLLGIRLGSIGG